MTEIKTWRHSETLKEQFALGSKTVVADDKLRFKFSAICPSRPLTIETEYAHVEMKSDIIFVVNYANYHFMQFYISLVT